MGMAFRLIFCRLSDLRCAVSATPPCFSHLDSVTQLFLLLRAIWIDANVIQVDFGILGVAEQSGAPL